MCLHRGTRTTAQVPTDTCTHEITRGRPLYTVPVHYTPIQPFSLYFKRLRDREGLLDPVEEPERKEDRTGDTPNGRISIKMN